jgi:hypothetical protein
MGEPSNALPPVEVVTLVVAVPGAVGVEVVVVVVVVLVPGVEVEGVSVVVEVVVSDCEATIPASHARRTSDDPASHRARLARRDAVDVPLCGAGDAPAGIAALQKGQVVSPRRT